MIEEKDVVVCVKTTDGQKIFSNDRSAHTPINESFEEIWRNIPVAALTHYQIEQYLENQGHQPMKDTARSNKRY